MDNMPFKYVDSFSYTELGEFDKLVLPHVPGVQRPLYELQREETIRDFCRRTDVLMALHSRFIIFEDQRVYNLFGVPDVLDILSIRDVRVVEDGRPLTPKAYLLDADQTTFTLQKGWESGLNGREITPLMSMTLAHGASRIETNFFQRWSHGIAAGIVRDLMVIPRKQWTNPQAAPIYDVKYEREVTNAKCLVSRNFGNHLPRTLPGHFE